MKRLYYGSLAIIFLIVFHYSRTSLDKNMLNQHIVNIISHQKVLNELLLRNVFLGNRQKVTECINKGAHLNTYDANKNTPLMLAVMTKNAALVNILLIAGARINMQNAQGKTALHLALNNQCDECIELLMFYNPNTGLKDMNGQSALQLLRSSKK